MVDRECYVIHGNYVTSVRAMIFKAISNNILAISWRSGLLEEESGVPGENHIPSTSH